MTIMRIQDRLQLVQQLRITTNLVSILRLGPTDQSGFVQFMLERDLTALEDDLSYLSDYPVFQSKSK